MISVLYSKAHDYIAPRLEGNFIQILDVNPFIFQVAGILVIMGAFIGIWGSLMSVRKFLKI
jgi:cell division transport system permease protein